VARDLDGAGRDRGVRKDGSESLSFEGMDIGEVQNLAARLDANARGLSAVAGVLGGLVTDLERLWLGPAFSAFARDFETSHRPAMLAAAQTLSDVHAKLVANIDQQVTASSGATEGGVAGGFGAVLAGAAAGGLAGAVLRDASPAWNLVNEGFSVEGSVVQDPIGIIGNLAGADPVSGLEDTTLGSWLTDSDQVQSVDQFFTDSHVYAVTDKIGDAGEVLGAIGIGVDVVAGGLDVKDGNYAAAGGQAVNATAAGLSYFGPVGTLGGIDLGLAKADYDEITMGGPLPSVTWSNITNEYIPDFTYLLPEEAWEEKGDLLKVI